MDRLLKTLLGWTMVSLCCTPAYAEVANLGELVAQGQKEQASTYRQMKEQMDPNAATETIRIFRAGSEPLTPLEVRIIPKSERKQIKIARAFKK